MSHFLVTGIWIQTCKKELHWFCRVCQAGAEKLLQIVSRIQIKVEKIEEEVVRVKSEIRTELAKAIIELRTEFAPNHCMQDQDYRPSAGSPEIHRFQARCYGRQNEK